MLSVVSGDFKMQNIILPVCCVLWWRIYRVPQPVFPSESESRVWKWGVQWYKSVNKLPSRKPPTSQSQYHYIENCCCCRSDREKPFVDLSAISWLASRCQFSISRALKTYGNVKQVLCSLNPNWIQALKNTHGENIFHPIKLSPSILHH